MGARRAIRRRRSINAEIQAQMILAAVWIPKRVGLRLRPSLAWGGGALALQQLAELVGRQ